MRKITNCNKDASERINIYYLISLGLINSKITAVFKFYTSKPIYIYTYIHNNHICIYIYIY